MRAACRRCLISVLQCTRYVSTFYFLLFTFYFLLSTFYILLTTYYFSTPTWDVVRGCKVFAFASPLVQSLIKESCVPNSTNRKEMEVRSSLPQNDATGEQPVFGRDEKPIGTWQVLRSGVGWTPFAELTPIIELQLTSLAEQKNSKTDVSWTRKKVKYSASFSPQTGQFVLRRRPGVGGAVSSTSLLKLHSGK